MNGAQERTMGPDTPPSAAPPIPRRRFLRWLLGFSAVSTLAMVAAPVFAFIVPPKSTATGSGGRVLAGTVADIPLGKGKVVAMGSKPAIIVNTAQGIAAYSAICTHLGCIVAFDDLSGTIVCPCHDGRFSPANGSVVSGPPPSPLARITVDVDDKGNVYLVSS